MAKWPTARPTRGPPGILESRGVCGLLLESRRFLGLVLDLLSLVHRRPVTTSPPHDSLFKSVFQQPENAAGELQHVIAPELAAAIDWSTLTLEPGSFVDEALSNQHSDLLFSARARSSQEQVLVYLLFEHRALRKQRKDR